MARDWVEWHRAYADPNSTLSLRLEAVTGAIRSFLDDAPPGPIRVLSLCAGEARDVAGAATAHARAVDLHGVAAELSGGLASIAAVNLAAAGTNIEVRCADAGRTIHWSDVLPVDLLVIAGIFGNLTDRDVRRIIEAVPAITAPGATVVWTRHRKAPDLTPQIREWFDEAGCTPTAFLSEGAGSYAVGVERRGDGDSSATLPELLFRFIDDER